MAKIEWREMDFSYDGAEVSYSREALVTLLHRRYGAHVESEAGLVSFFISALKSALTEWFGAVKNTLISLFYLVAVIVQLPLIPFVIVYKELANYQVLRMIRREIKQAESLLKEETEKGRRS